MPTRRAARRKHALSGIPVANLFGKPVPISLCRIGGATHQYWNESDHEPRAADHRAADPFALWRLRSRMRDTLARLQESGTLTAVQARRVRFWLRHPHKGVRELADVEGVSPAAIECCAKAIAVKWPAFRRMWRLKKLFITRRGPTQC
jgi:hypothetical protein